jgi:hypothetical protein
VYIENFLSEKKCYIEHGTLPFTYYLFSFIGFFKACTSAGNSAFDWLEFASSKDLH